MIATNLSIILICIMDKVSSKNTDHETYNPGFLDPIRFFVLIAGLFIGPLGLLVAFLGNVEKPALLIFIGSCITLLSLCALGIPAYRRNFLVGLGYLLAVIAIPVTYLYGQQFFEVVPVVIIFVAILIPRKGMIVSLSTMVLGVIVASLMHAELDLALYYKQVFEIVAVFLMMTVFSHHGQKIFHRNEEAIQQLKDTDQLIERQNRQLQKSQEIAKIGFWEYDVRNDRLTWSGEIQKLFGVELQGFQSTFRSFLRYVHPDDREMVYKAYVDAVARKTGYQLKHRVRRKNGSILYVNEIADHEYDENGEIIRSMGTVQDISEQAAKENQLITITDTSPDAIVMMDHEGNISFWNPAARLIFGYEREEVMGRNLHELLSPKRYHAAHKAAYPKFLETGKGGAIDKTVELHALHKDGHEIDIALSLGAVKKDNRWQAAAVVRDITTQKKVEETIQSQKDELETIFQTSLEGISLLDMNKTFTFINRRFAQMFGYSEEEMRTKNCRDLTDPEAYDELDRVLAEVMEKGFYEGFERYCITKGGKRKRVKSSIALMPNRKSLLMTSEDVTERMMQLSLSKSRRSPIH